MIIRKSLGGFTLLEVTISLVILSMILLATSTALRTFANSKGAVDAVVERADNVRLVSAFLRRTLGAAMPVVSTDQSALGGPFDDSTTFDRNYGVAFSGARNSVVWVAPFTGGTTLGGVHMLRLAREDDQLVLRWVPWRGPAGRAAWASAPRHVVMEDVETFTLAYRPAFGEAWVSRWEGEANNPVAVSVSLQAGGRFMPEIIVAFNDGQMNQR